MKLNPSSTDVQNVTYVPVCFFLYIFETFCLHVCTEKIRRFEYIFILLLQLAYFFSPTSKCNLCSSFLLQFDTKILRYESVIIIIINNKKNVIQKSFEAGYLSPMVSI